MAVESVGKALKQRENYPEAHELLAKLALEDSNIKKAREEADLAIAQDPEALDAMAIHLAIDLLDDKTDSPWAGRILAINPHYGRAWSNAAASFIHNRRYEEGIALYKRAIELDPEYLEAYSELGVNLMRLAREKEAREVLEHAYQNGYQERGDGELAELDRQLQELRHLQARPTTRCGSTRRKRSCCALTSKSRWSGSSPPTRRSTASP